MSHSAPTTINFGEWLPDLPAFGLAGTTTATNVIPDAGSYRSFPQLQLFSTLLPNRVRGTVFAVDNARNSYNYIGDSSHIYQLAQQSFTTVTRLAGGNYSLDTNDTWEFANWGNSVYATHGFSDAVQRISLGAANFGDAFSGFKARHIAAVGDFMVYANISDSAANVYRVRWSGIGNPTAISVSAATLADFQDLPSTGGHVQKILGGEYGVVLQERSVWRMQFIGAPVIFQFDLVHETIGAYLPQAALRHHNLVFFLSSDGFYSFDGTRLTPIGAGKVDKFFFSDLSLPYASRVHSALDPSNKLVLWAYPSFNSMAGNPDKLLAYSWAFNRWILVEGLKLDWLFQAATAGYTLDGLDAVSGSLDGLPVSLDSEQWTGGQILLSAFDYLHQMGYFNGNAMAATVETTEFQLYPGQKATILEARPLITGFSASLTVSLLNRNKLTESLSVAATVALTSDGLANFRHTARYFRLRLVTEEGVDFAHLSSLEVSGVPAGVR